MRGERKKDRMETYSLSGEALTEYLSILVDEEVSDGILIAVSGGRLGERPAPSWCYSVKNGLGATERRRECLPVDEKD